MKTLQESLFDSDLASKKLETFRDKYILDDCIYFDIFDAEHNKSNVLITTIFDKSKLQKYKNPIPKKESPNNDLALRCFYGIIMDYPILNMNELHNKTDEEQWENGLKEILSKYISPKYKETLENIVIRPLLAGGAPCIWMFTKSKHTGLKFDVSLVFKRR